MFSKKTKLSQFEPKNVCKLFANEEGVVNESSQPLDFQSGGSGIRTQDPLRARQVL